MKKEKPKEFVAGKGALCKQKQFLESYSSVLVKSSLKVSFDPGSFNKVFLELFWTVRVIQEFF